MTGLSIVKDMLFMNVLVWFLTNFITLRSPLILGSQQPVKVKRFYTNLTLYCKNKQNYNIHKIEDQERVAANITNYNIVSKLIFLRIIIPNL